MHYSLALLILIEMVLACGGQQPELTLPNTANTRRAALPPDTIAPRPDTVAGFVEIRRLDSTILLDIRYATANNFTGSKIYDCPRCFLRPETARALVRAQKKLQAQGLGLKLFDCYRPRPYQQRLWDKVPDPNYVMPPAKGSMHSRGAAVDLTLVDAKGNELDMGTPYDFFGPKAHYDYTKLPAKVLENRRLLRRTMEAVGLKGIRTEWWHFSFQGKNFPLSDWVWPCPRK
jgi:D-alanyl-D-alanine dipeptidase